MAQVIATGRWLKKLKTWSMVVAIRRPTRDKQAQPQTGRRHPRPEN